MAEGVTDRLRSLPVARVAVVGGRVVGQLCEAVLGLVVVAGLGLALGWRPDVAPSDVAAVAGLLLAALFGAMWAGVLLGMRFRSPDAVQGVGFSIVLPASFLAGTFVPIDGMDLMPRTIAKWNPLAALVAATRELTGGAPPAGGSWMLEHPIAGSLAWTGLLVAVCLPLAVRRFGKAGG